MQTIINGKTALTAVFRFYGKCVNSIKKFRQCLRKGKNEQIKNRN